ncbi:MAG: PorT family protein [Marinilabiliales bacterium]|nr:PorT family protein [Marinilabiliales bacterium]
MKTKLILATLLLAATTQMSMAQDTVKVNVLGKNLVTVVEDGSKTNVKIGDNNINVNDNSRDTVKIRVGRKTMVVTEGRHGTKVAFDQLDDKKFEQWTGHAPKFKGHWSTLEIGVNSFTNPDYAGYTIPPSSSFHGENYLDINHNKSLEVNINLIRFSFGLQEKKNNIGLVTGLGFNFNDYRFSNGFTIKNENGYIVPIPISSPKLQKTKLSTGYLTVPLLLEIHAPRRTGLWMSMGVIGGIKMGSHTKVKIDGTKDKDHNDFNISPFRGGATARIGYKGLNLYGTYYFTPFFRDNRGPSMQPFTIGLGLLNF